MQTMDSIQDILNECQFDDWKFYLGFSQNQPYLQLKFTAPCSKTGVIQDWTCRKWLLSFHMVKNEIVQTAFKAVLAAVEHETREKFHYRGESIFDPHIDVDKLAEFCKGKDSRDIRK